MFKRTVIGAALAAAMCLAALGAPGMAAAVDDAGSGPAQAMTPSSEWTALPASTDRWYSFAYAGDGSQIDVWLDVAPGSSAAFSIWTPQQVEAWARGEAVQPVGRGSFNEYGPGSLNWSGNFNMPGAYYVVVENKGVDTSYYAMHLAGNGVTIAAEPAQEAAVQAAAEPAADKDLAAVPAATDGLTPGDAFATPAHSVPVAPSTGLWHKFQYAGDQSQILVWLDDLSGSGLTFSVWTPEQVHQMEMGHSVEPVGRGSANVYAPGNLSWSGNFVQAGTYYLKVENASAAEGTYTLSILGSSVW